MLRVLPLPAARRDTFPLTNILKAWAAEISLPGLGSSTPAVTFRIYPSGTTSVLWRKREATMSFQSRTDLLTAAFSPGLHLESGSTPERLGGSASCIRRKNRSAPPAARH